MPHDTRKLVATTVSSLMSHRCRATLEHSRRFDTRSRTPRTSISSNRRKPNQVYLVASCVNSPWYFDIFLPASAEQLSLSAS